MLGAHGAAVLVTDPGQDLAPPAAPATLAASAASGAVQLTWDAVDDEAWIADEYIPRVAKRGAEIIGIWDGASGQIVIRRDQLTSVAELAVSPFRKRKWSRLIPKQSSKTVAT